MDRSTGPSGIAGQSLDELEALDEPDDEAAGLLESLLPDSPLFDGESDFAEVSVFFEPSLLSLPPFARL